MIPARDGSCCTRQNLRSDGTCGPPPVVDTCPSLQVRVGNSCCTREQITARTCGTPTGPGTGGCKGKQIRNSDGNCQDPPSGTGRCGKNQFRGDDGKCQDRPTSAKPRCDKGTSWDGAKCAKNTGTQQQCQQSFRWDGRRCVPTQKKPTKQAKPGLNRTIDPRNTLKPPVQGGSKQPTGLNRKGR